MATNLDLGWILPGALAASLALVGCGGDTQRAPTRVHLELISWWVSADEKEALDALVAVHRQWHPNVDVANSNVAGYAAAGASIRSSMAGGQPPNTFQANIGYDLLRWVTLTEQPTLEPLGPPIELDAFPQRLRENASSGGSMYGVPVNVHRINSLFYDKRFFEQNGLVPPQSVQDFRTLCPAIQQLNRTCLAVGGLDGSFLSQLTFEMILPGIGGAAYYTQFWQGTKQPTDKPVTDALDLIRYLRCGPEPTLTCDHGFINSDADAIGWPDAVERVMNGTDTQPQAAMMATGDWAKGNFVSRDWVEDEDFGVVPFPSQENVFVYTADTFPLPLGVTHRAETIDLLTTFASVEGQVAFNLIKGSIPARTDIRAEDYPSMQKTMQEFQDAIAKGTLALARTGLQKPNAMLGLDQLMHDSLADGNFLRIQQYLQANYTTLAQ